MNELSAIRIDKLVKRYGERTAICDMTFQVSRGEIFAFLGPNGAGKTTTVKILTTLVLPTAGLAEIGGIDVVRNYKRARRRFGVVFQESTLDQDMTAIEHMHFQGSLYGLSRKRRLSRIEHLLGTFELWDRRNDRVRLFSGGMRRRLEIARGLMHSPEILFLDEPSAGLDPQSRRHLWSLVKALNRQQNLTIFMTTHYLEEAERVAHRIVIVDQGRVIADGSADSLKHGTATQTLEEAFVSLTGSTLRDE